MATANFCWARRVAEKVKITALGHGGDGVAAIGGAKVFVPYTLPGETVEIEPAEERGTLLRVIEPSPDRVPPLCPNFGACGICALEHMARPAYLEWKRQQVVAAFEQRGLKVAVEPIVPIDVGNRRRAVFSAMRTAKGVVFGFHARNSHAIVPITECAVLTPPLSAKLTDLRAIAEVALSRWKPARVTVLAADNGFDVTFADAGKPDRTMIDGVEVFRNRQPELAAGPATIFPAPGGFVQAAKAAEDALAETAVASVGNATRIADLFSGIGTFSFRLAKRAAVTAVESDEAAVAALELAARRATGLKKLTARRRDLFVNPLSPTELNMFDAVVFDPPASGAKAQAEMLAKSKVPVVIAVSCNPATLARDARVLIDGGYRLDRVRPVDQFLFSAEIEAVAVFVR
jgi:23S rRNA (uracil1939-C5)-methyltransferase